jgi:hypothetical protein
LLEVDMQAADMSIEAGSPLAVLSRRGD